MARVAASARLFPLSRWERGGKGPTEPRRRLVDSRMHTLLCKPYGGATDRMGLPATRAEGWEMLQVMRDEHCGVIGQPVGDARLIVLNRPA